MTDTIEMTTIVDESAKSLKRVQSFDIATMARREELGSDLNFTEAEAPAKKVIDLFLQIPSEQLSALPDNWVTQIKNVSDSFFSILDSTTKFKASVDNSVAVRTSLLSQITNSYQDTFNQLSPIISYVSSRQRDYAAMEREARAKIQQASDRADEMAKSLSSYELEAKRVLDEVKKVAAEQGVSQQAIYFQNESKFHQDEADKWQRWTLYLAVTLVIYAALSLLIHKIPFLIPISMYDSIQLAISKSLVFAVFAYMLFLSARNFLSHKHNAIVNKHRQNALLTFKTLADAAGTQENRDIVLTHAAACIFAPQDTGYIKVGQQSNFGGIIEALPRMISTSQGTH